MVSVLALIVMLTVAGSALAQTSPPETAAPADSHPLASRLHVMNDYENYVGEAFAFGSMIHANPGNGFPDTRLYGWDCQATQWEQPWIGMTVEASGYYGKIHYPFGAGGPSKVGTDQISTMAGPNFRPIRRKLVSASFFGLIGTVRAHIDQRELGVTLQYDDDMKLGFAFGSSVDFRIRRWVGWGVQPAVYTTRFAGQTQKDFRLSTGPVFRFNRREN
jgi:hypothetical protein